MEPLDALSPKWWDTICRMRVSRKSLERYGMVSPIHNMKAQRAWSVQTRTQTTDRLACGKTVCVLRNNTKQYSRILPRMLGVVLQDRMAS
ncbi:hypothetical protein BofuT4_P032570.1 [Botrytis cinerea T4]|uniref:Uncharacterized protein n=1 Tax=Botryotinia fuckeliana (strain T4) TaxID=999810 RepID=G2Y8B9_BOTF4|nr:hypothetical protein BofuT4_P032570.1 [Botrytis cinerea T4]